MICVKCKREIPDDSIYCPYCGKKQTATKAKYHKREHGTGTIVKDKRYKNPWLAYAPMTNPHQLTRKYLGCFATRSEAAAAIEKYINQGCPCIVDPTLQEVYELWHKQHFKTISDNTAVAYSSMWKHLEPLYNAKIADIRTPHLQEIVNSCNTSGTAGRLKVVIRLVFQFALENDFIDKDYSQFVKLPKSEKKEKKIFTTEQIKTLWQHSDDDTVQMILILIYTGFRIGELLNLRKSDVHDTYIVGGEKTEAGRNRIVPLPPNIPEISEFIRKRLDGKTDRLFPMSSRTFGNKFNDCLFSLGILDGERHPKGYYIFADRNHLTPHSTRHTFASLSANAGVSPDSLQKIIGHANFTTTADIYIHKDLEKLTEEMKKITK